LKLASLRSGRDGVLVVVSRDLGRAARVPEVAGTLQAALDDWERCAPRLEEAAAALEAGSAREAFPLDPHALAAPLPRAYQWLDASAYLNHVELVRRARGAELPPALRTDPLLYQGGSDALLGPRDEIRAESEDWGIDFEAEVAVVSGDLPTGASAGEAAAAIRLVLLANDVSLRNLIPAELAKGFGFLQSKPPTAFSPVAATPGELGPAWDGRRLHGALRVEWNGELFGAPDAGVDMNFDFPTLLAHAARTRPLGAGTILGSGTVSNRDHSRGSCCIAERRTLETLASGAPETRFLAFGDRVRIEMLDAEGRSLFGAIDQRVARAPAR
jgi:fumarylacetoacetate (FAA) hydrolase